MAENELRAVAEEIAGVLGETEQKPCTQIAAIVEQCGVEFAQTILRETQETEAQGGLLLPDQSRRRTPGGVFFFLARKKMPRETARQIFPPYRGNPSGEKKPKHKIAPPPLFNWAERRAIIQPLLGEKGVLTTVKVTLIGRPGRIDSSHKDLIITTMSHVAKTASFPKGVPPPPETPTLYTVYISAKQWKRVEESIANPDDALIVEGTCAFDDQIGGMAVFALSVTSKQLEAKKRQTPKETPVRLDASPVDASVPSGDSRFKTAFEQMPSETTSSPADPNVPDAPNDVVQKLNELYASASLFRQKIAAIQSKPAGQQFGLEMTQKLLKNIEDEIAAIEKKYQH